MTVGYLSQKAKESGNFFTGSETENTTSGFNVGQRYKINTYPGYGKSYETTLIGKTNSSIEYTDPHDPDGPGFSIERPVKDNVLYHTVFGYPVGTISPVQSGGMNIISSFFSKLFGI